jgi:hypothetical protein
VIGRRLPFRAGRKRDPLAQLDCPSRRCLSRHITPFLEAPDDLRSYGPGRLRSTTVYYAPEVC